MIRLRMTVRRSALLRLIEWNRRSDSSIIARQGGGARGGGVSIVVTAQGQRTGTGWSFEVGNVKGRPNIGGAMPFPLNATDAAAATIGGR